MICLWTISNPYQSYFPMYFMWCKFERLDSTSYQGFPLERLSSFRTALSCLAIKSKFPNKHHKKFMTNVVGMSIEKMWRNDEFWNFHATYSNVFFWSTKLRQPRQCRDSCTYYMIFQNFVILSFRHIFSIDMPTTLVKERSLT